MVLTKFRIIKHIKLFICCLKQIASGYPFKKMLEAKSMDAMYALWWHTVKLSNAVKKQCLKEVGSSEALFKGHISCLSEEQRLRCDTSHDAQESLKQCIDRCHQLGIHLVGYEDKGYPPLLKELDDPPMMLFAKGDVGCLQQPMLALVGSRKCSEYGFEMAKKLGEELSDYKSVVVSGMARGIDEGAHIGALKQGQTVAVLGTGVDRCYPAQNRKLYEQILQQGCVLSEFLPGTEALPFHFPMRNRIISGMSLGTVVVEAEIKSGSLITAQLALEQNREVFAVPGNVFSLFSQGTNKLIQAGAKLVVNAEDIMSEFSDAYLSNFKKPSANSSNNQSILLDKVEIMVYDCLSRQPIQIEKLHSAIVDQHMPIQTLEMVLLKLELKGLVQRLPARRYSRMK